MRFSRHPVRPWPQLWNLDRNCRAPIGSVKPHNEAGQMHKSDEMTTNQDLEQLAALFRLLSDRTRLNILLLLGGGERNVGELCQMLQLPQPTVSHHLGLLRMNNVIGNRRAGKQ